MIYFRISLRSACNTEYNPKADPAITVILNPSLVHNIVEVLILDTPHPHKHTHLHPSPIIYLRFAQEKLKLVRKSIGVTSHSHPHGPSTHHHHIVTGETIPALPHTIFQSPAARRRSGLKAEPPLFGPKDQRKGKGKDSQSYGRQKALTYISLHPTPPSCIGNWLVAWWTLSICSVPGR